MNFFKKSSRKYFGFHAKNISPLKIVNSVSRSVLFRHVAHKVTYCGAFLEEKFVTFWYTFGDCHFLVYFWWVWQIYTSNTGNKLTKETTQPRQHPGLSYWVNSVFANFDSLNQCNEIGILGPKVHCFQSLSTI